jgi:3',5'-cyclic-AMP phosphodiesterase
MKFIKLSFILTFSFAILLNISSAENQITGKDYYRIVVLGDPHLPFKYLKITDEKKQKKIIDEKENAIKDINSWKDADLAVAVGDITGETGSDSEYDYAKNFFKKLNVQVLPITGNHDFTYQTETKNNKLVHGTVETAFQKLKKFETTFGLENISYTREISNYFLVFLSADKVDGKHQVELTKKSLSFLENILKSNRNKPTIIFFHAPLKGTLIKKGTPSKGNDAAQPDKKIDEILKENPQVFLWISGHTHTPPTDKSYNAAENLYDNRILNIHNTDMDRKQIWTNSLFLYNNKVIIKTYDHANKKWLPEMERTVTPPEIKK